MYLFRRSANARPDKVQEASAFAVDIAARITRITTRQVSVFTAAFGLPLGSISWTIPVASFADLHDLRGKLEGDPGYGELLAAGTEHFAALPSDDMINLVSSTLGTEVQRFYGSTVAVPANGRIAEAMAFGVRAQAHVAAKTGLKTSFGTSVFGAFGAVGWLVGADSMADVDRYQQFLATDGEFLSMIDASGPLFAPGSSVNALVERIN